MMSKYIESYGKHGLAVNQRYPTKAIQEAILCFELLKMDYSLIIEENCCNTLHLHIVVKIIPAYRRCVSMLSIMYESQSRSTAKRNLKLIDKYPYKKWSHRDL